MSQSSASTQIVENTDLVNVLTDLQVGIRKISMYGLSHSIVPKIAKNLSQKLSLILETATSLPLVIGKNEVLYQEAVIASGNAVIQELSQTLHRLNIIQVTFKKGLREDAVLKFLSFILKNRAKTFTQDDPLIAQFHEEVPHVVLRLVTFKDAITLGVQSGQQGGNLWQNLLNHAGDSKIPEEVRRLIDADSDSPPTTEAVAVAINALYAETGLKKEAYEKTVLEFLKRQTLADDATLVYSEAEGGQNLAELFSKLRRDVREQVFKLSMQTQDDQVMPLENFLSHMPASLLPEVLQQMDLSSGALAPPAYRLIKKVVSLAKDNQEIKAQVADTLKEHKALREELMPEKAKDTSENAIQDFSKKMAESEKKAFSDAEIDHQLALTLLEILEQPGLADGRLARCLELLQNILIQGIGDDTLKVLMDTFRVLLKNFGTARPEHKLFWRTQLKKMLIPKIVVQLLKVKEALKGRADVVVSGLVSIAGEDLFRVALHVLEVEKHLSTRKQVLRFLIGCGSAVIPATLVQLKNPQWFVVRNMLVILKGVKAMDEVLEIIPCVKHKVWQVRLAALQTLGAIASETDLLLDVLGIALHDQDENVSKTAISMLIASRHEKAAVFVRNLFLEAEDNGKWRAHQVLLLTEMQKNASQGWLPTLLEFRKGFFFMLLHWGQKRQVQSAIRETIAEIEKKGAV